ncbi:gluconokinase [Acetobacter estunensis]|uniref:gluconokinase n=1 Tax=Acetobacter estunensis TaxID=104097 RepID=UPI001C2D19AB|nr:gluconokinase [Acetobacter estunensis]MBV1838082.1 gluconokinase [Acetobacter estunensis]
MEQPVAQGITPRIVVLMGVTASGKTMVAEGLHNLLGWPFQEGDDLHPKSNIEKMAAGIPLTDEDRLPWLQACRAWIDARAREGGGGIMSCSALKRSYRQLLAADGVDITFLLLNVPRDVLEQRLKGRKGHFMPASLLDSQLATLEPPGPDEHVLILNALSSPARTIARALELLRVDQA